MSEANKLLLDRESSLKSANDYNFGFNLINDVLDYGTNILPKAFDNSPHDTEALCIIGVLFRQTLVHLDAIATLARAGNCFSANLQCRSLLEIYLTLVWLLKRDTSVKANHLLVANLRRRRQWQSIAIPGTPEAIRHPDEASRFQLDARMRKQIDDEIRHIDRILSDPEYSTINAAFESNYQRNNYDKQWYEVYGISSIRKIAEDIGKLKEYRHFYSSLSEISHGGSIWKNLTLGKEKFVNPIREPEKIPALANFASSYSFMIFRIILEQYLPKEIDNFNNKYVKEWRTRFLHSVPKGK